MKFLIVIASVNPSGGGPIEGVKNSSMIMEDLGHKVEVLSLDAPQDVWARSFPFTLFSLGKGEGGYGYSPALVTWLRINAGNYDAVIVQGIWQYHSFAVWRALNNSQVPYFVFTHGMLSTWFKKSYPLKHLKKWLYWPWAEYRVLRDAKCVFFTTEEERILARQSFWLYQCHERVVGYGTKEPPEVVRKQTDAFLSAFPGLLSKPFFLFLSRIHPVKGCDLLIEAFSLINMRDRDWHLVMAGPDQAGWQKQLTLRCEELGISDRVHWVGMLHDEIKWGAYNAAKAFVLPSHQENFGVVVAEALACGCPVLITNKVNIWRVVEECGAGLIDEDSVNGIENLLNQFLGLPQEAVVKMENEAKNCFLDNFEIKKATINLLDVIKEELACL